LQPEAGAADAIKAPIVNTAASTFTNRNMQGIYYGSSSEVKPINKNGSRNADVSSPDLRINTSAALLPSSANHIKH
jgi:hypothetical protein